MSQCLACEKETEYSCVNGHSDLCSQCLRKWILKAEHVSCPTCRCSYQDLSDLIVSYENCVECGIVAKDRMNPVIYPCSHRFHIRCSEKYKNGCQWCLKITNLPTVPASVNSSSLS